MPVRCITEHMSKGRIMTLDNPVIYLDHAATTSPKQEVVSIYRQALQDYFYNPSSVHQAGTRTSRALEQARQDILNDLHLGDDYNLIFTSGASESNNLAIKGFANRYKTRGKHIISTSFEHPSVTKALEALKKDGFEITYLTTNNGRIDLDELNNVIREDTILISIIAVNNEVGFIQDIKGIRKVINDHPKIKLHIDAVQALGKIAINYALADLITFSLHKIGGLKSSGLLIKKKTIDLLPLIDGGGQENGLRSGTNDVPLALASAQAIKLAVADINKAYEHCYELAKVLYDYLAEHEDIFEINSSIDNPFIINFSFINRKASVFVEALSARGIMVASQSACSSRNDKGSYTLINIGKSSQIAKNAIRVSIDESNTLQEVEIFINTLNQLLKEIRG